MSDLQWSSPPEPATRRVDWEDVAADLRKRPGQWALVAQNVSASTATNIRTGRYAGMPAGQFDATARKREDGDRHDVWAMALPADGAAS